MLALNCTGKSLQCVSNAFHYDSMLPVLHWQDAGLEAQPWRSVHRPVLPMSPGKATCLRSSMAASDAFIVCCQCQGTQLCSVVVCKHSVPSRRVTDPSHAS